MEIKCTIDTDDLSEEMDFESLLTMELQKKVVVNCKKSLAADTFNRFATLVSDTIVAEIKLKMENFLSEDIALTDNWGKPIFIGSVDDLIKKRIDDILLRPVDSYGKAITGCVTTGKTWLQWKLDKTLEDEINFRVSKATSGIKENCKKCVAEKITEIKDGAIKAQVDKAFVSILQQK